MVIEKNIFEICLLKAMENFTRENQRYYIWVCWKNGKGADDVHKELVIAEGTKALSKRTIYRWIEAFEAGQSSIEDAPRSGRPREAVTPSNVNIVEDLISNDPHISIESIQEVIPISAGSIETILRNELSVKKVCAKWVPHVTTMLRHTSQKSSLSTSRKNESYCSPTLLTVLIWHHATSFYFQTTWWKAV